MLTRLAPSNGFRSCDPCGGLGFLRKGEFADRTFPRCTACEGLGQVYLDEAKPIAEPPW
jgi:hypothetical protein